MCDTQVALGKVAVINVFSLPRILIETRQDNLKNESLNDPILQYSASKHTCREVRKKCVQA